MMHNKGGISRRRGKCGSGWSGEAERLPSSATRDTVIFTQFDTIIQLSTMVQVHASELGIPVGEWVSQ